MILWQPENVSFKIWLVFFWYLNCPEWILFFPIATVYQLNIHLYTFRHRCMQWDNFFRGFSPLNLKGFLDGCFGFHITLKRHLIPVQPTKSRWNIQETYTLGGLPPPRMPVGNESL